MAADPDSTPRNKAEKPKKNGLAESFMNLLSSQFPAHDENVNETNATLEDDPIGGGGVGYSHLDAVHGHIDNDGESERDSLSVYKRPIDRASKYSLIQEILQDPTANEGLDIHISYALAPDSKKNLCFELEATAPEHEKLIAELNARLTPKISKKLAAWAKISAAFGINFVRPYCKEGVGITHFQCDYFTMPNFIRKYEKAGLLAGYTSQHLRDQKKGNVSLAPPWALLEIKIPFFEPNMNIEPNKYDGNLYSLYDDVLDQTAVEAQDYGTSFLEYSFEPYHDFKEALESLRASRRNASRIDRLIATQLENLDPIAAAEYLNLLAQQMKSNSEYIEQRHRQQGTKPLINDSIIPVQGGAKGGVTIDTQSTDPNIQHIEDLMLHLKRYTSSFGLDLSLLGWADSMSGGLGEGGYFQTSIQAARRSLWIRQACEEFILDSLDLDFWFKYKKVLPDGVKKPWKVKFFSQNSAIEEQENMERESKANFATIVATLIDTIALGSTNNSPTLKKILLNGVLDVTEETLTEILNELDKPKEGEKEGLMSSLSGMSELEQLEFLLGKLSENAE